MSAARRCPQPSISWSPRPASADRFPCFTRRPCSSCKELARSYRDLNLKILFKDGDALITRARASLVSQFLDDPDATHLLFVDADIGFEPEQVLRLIECGADICAAVYPIKRIDWDKVRSIIEAGGPIRRRRR